MSLRKFVAAMVAAVMCMAMVSPAWGVALSLSSLDDLSNLEVGDTVTIDVSLEGVEATAGGLSSLSGSVLFPGGLMGTPLSITPGAIVPDPSDFLSLSFPGQADGLFFQLSGAPITSNGVFYSFEVQAQAPGSGAFAFDALALTGEDAGQQFPNNLVIVDAGARLPFTINAPNNIIPEPATAGLMVLGMGGLLIRRRQRAA